MPRRTMNEKLDPRHSNESEGGTSRPTFSPLERQRVLRAFGPSRVLGRGSRLVDLSIRKRL